MDQERFKQIDALFDEVLDAPTRERERILDARCGADAELKREVLKLFSALKNSPDLIAERAFTPAKDLLDSAPDDRLTGAKIGAYRLKKLLGRGGMGAVYLAARTDDFEKEVAVKIIPPFENRRGQAENFRRERQILARLEHENIARILDGGTSADGSPFLVMEYVDGLPLDEYCRAKGLNLREKLALFQKVCRAVTFAHRNLIVHRDLKPNNILVSADGAPKLLDFGIAKLLNADALDFSENKTLEAAALTPEYASPEQTNGANITTASDVYSLGVILYELLAQQRPFDLRGKSLAEILKIIQTEEPAPPSAKSSIADDELDAVVLKSLAKSPAERYQSVEDLRADIERFLDNQPVAARPPTLVYRFRKYVRRHFFEVAVAAVFAAILLGWTLTAIIQRRDAERQARENRRSAYAAEMILAANEYENANLNRLREIVEKYKPTPDAEDLRGFEWYLLNGLLNPPTKINSFHHPDEVWNAEFSPDGKFIASACNDNRVRVWNVENGQVIETPEQRGAWKVAFFPDGSRFAVASSSNSEPLVKIYETATAREILTLKGHTKRIRAVDVSPDGKTIATGSQDGNIIIRNAENGAELKRFSFSTPQKGVEFYDLQFSKNGERLAALGFETLVIFDTRSWNRKQIDGNEFTDKNIFLNGWKLAFSPLGKTLAVGTFNGDIAFLDAETLKILRVLKLHQANVKSFAFSPDGGTLITGSADRTVKFVDVQSGAVKNELRGHFSAVHEVAISPDGTKLATASADFNLNLWNAAALAEGNAILTNHAIFALSPDARTIFGWNGGSHEISSWSVTDKRKTAVVKSEVNAFAADFSEPKKLSVFGERDGYITLFDASNLKQIHRFKTPDRNIYAVAFTPDGEKILASYEDGAIKCFQTETGAEIFAIQASKDNVKTLAVAPDGKTFAAGSNDKLVRLFETATGKELYVFEGNTKPLYKVVFSPNGEFLAAGGADDTLRIWRVADRKQFHEFTGMSAGIFAIAFSPDGKRLATASDVGVIRLWDTENGSQVLALTASSKQINYLKFTPDGETLISVDGEGKLRFWQGKE